MGDDQQKPRGILSHIFDPFRWAEGLLKRLPFFSKFESGIPLKAKVIIAVLVFMSILGGGFTAFQLYDFTQNDPGFCSSCHLMKNAFDSWQESVHKKINCHDCHHLSIPEANMLLFNFVVHRPDRVPDRHGKVIVPWKTCMKCHWEEDARYPEAHSINGSRMHAKHYFMERVECSKCHGYKLHQFLPEERFCVMCHKDKTVHGKGMGELACLNCHTDIKADLRPSRDKCLACHGSDEMRKDISDKFKDTVDVKYFMPESKVAGTAIKIELTKDSPMQFDCNTCHHPHQANRPDWGNCLKCHERELEVGMHGLHIQEMGLNCKKCHRPHLWKVTEKYAKKICTECHEYRSPHQYLKGKLK